jgi:signal transduction histidine kinase
MVRAVSRGGLCFREELPIILVVCLGIGFSTGIFFITKNYYQAQAKQEFERPAAQYKAAVERAIDRYLDVINSVGAFFTATNSVDRWEFYKFVEDKRPRYPGLKAVEWVPKVRHGERRKYVSVAEDDGLFGFDITEFGEAESLTKAGKRDEYFPVYYVDPYQGNEEALGFDLASDPAILKSLDRARDFGRNVLIDGAAFPGGGADGSQFSVILPIYRSGLAPDSLAQRHEELTGFTIGIFHVDEMIRTALQDVITGLALDVYIYDQTREGEERLVYHHPADGNRGQMGPLREDQVFGGYFAAGDHSVADRQWTIVVKPDPAQFDSSETAWPLQFAAVCLFLTAILVQYMTSARNRTREIERSVAVRTAELSTANAALEAEVHERKLAEEEARAATDQAVLANRAKSEFLAMVSHELRTPLNAIIGFSEVLVGEMFGPIGEARYQDYASDIRNSGTHLLSLINDILDLSKIEADKYELYEQEIEPGEILQSALRIVRERAKEAGIKVITEIDSPLPRLFADERALKQILINLLSNAVKFTPEGGRITVRAEIDARGDFLMSVADTGIGIHKDNVKKVLEPFRQVDTALSRKYEGTGLGLALTKCLVELHGGTLDLESELDHGTTVTVVLRESRVIPHSSAAE